MKNEKSMTELIAAIREGDQQAFTELYKLTSQEVYRTARAVLRDEEEALDVQQDTFVYAYNHLDQLSDPEKVRPWLRAIAVNRAKSILRRNSPLLFTELENEDGEGLPEQADLSAEASPELSLERKETAELVNEILGELSDGQRAAVAMYYYEQMPVAEIAEALGVSTSTVKNQLARGRKKIEEAVRALEKKGVKLYGLSPMSFLLALMKRQTPAVQQGELVLAKTLAKAGVASGAKAAAVPVAESVVLHATKPFFSTLVGKLVLGVLCVGAVGGGIAGYRWAKDEFGSKVSPLLYVDSAENLTQDTTAPTLPVELEKTESPAATEVKPDYSEDDEKLWGKCGEDLYWTLYKDSGKMIIEGSGDMTDYADADFVPWARNQSKIKSLQLPAGLTRIGNNAFSDCTKLTQMILPENLNAVGSGALSGCANLNQLWIMNRSCAIGDDLGDFPQLTIYGYPGSTAEQYAAKINCTFTPVEDNQTGVIEKLQQEQQINAHFTSMEIMLPVGDRYLAKVVTRDLLSASEDEILQAKQTGLLALNGTEYPYTESKAQAKLWGYVYDESEEAEGWVGWIQAERSVYSVLRRNGSYVFMENQEYGSGDPYMKQPDSTDIGWIWLDADTMTDRGKLGDYLQETIPENICGNFNLELDEEGNIRIVKISSGWK